MRKIKVRVLEGDNLPYEKAFDPEYFEIVQDIDEAEVICFTGGSDIHPFLYNDVLLNGSSASDPIRDLYEVGVVREYINDKILVGICRGFQLLSLLEGCSIVPHDPDHAMAQAHTLSNGELVNSLHHQRVVKGEYDINNGLYVGGCVEAWWDKENGGVQWHPELHEKGEFGFDYFNEQVRRLCNE